MGIETRGDFVLHVHSKLDGVGRMAGEVELEVVDGRLMDGDVGRQRKRARGELDCAGQATGRPKKYASRWAKAVAGRESPWFARWLLLRRSR
jgi:hypothetical protein